MSFRGSVLFLWFVCCGNMALAAQDDKPVSESARVLVIARPTRVELIESLSYATDTQVVISNRFAVTLEVLDRVIGKEIHVPRRVEVEMLATGENALRSRRIHLLLRQQADGKFVVEHWGYPATVACIPQSLATDERKANGIGLDVWFRRYAVPSSGEKCLMVD